VKVFVLGSLLGIAALAEAGILFFLIMLIAWIFVRLKQISKKEKMVYALILLVCVCFVLSLVTLRNYLVEKDFVLITAHSGINFFLGNNPQAQGGLLIPTYLRSTRRGLLEDARIYSERHSNRELRPSEVSNFWFRRAVSFIKNHPSNYFKLLLKKTKIFWHNFEPMDTMEFTLLLNKKLIFNLLTHSFGIIAPLGLLGFFIIRWKEEVVILFLFILSQFFASITFFVTSRNRLVVVPFLIIFASYFIYWVYTQFKERKIKPLLLALSSVMLIFMLLNLKNPGHKGMEAERSYNLGVLYTETGSYQEAEKYFTQAIDLKPSDHMIYFGLANVYYLKNDITKAAELYEKVIELSPNFLDAYFNLGLVYQEKGKLKEAEEFFNKVIDFDFRAYDAYFNLGNIYKSQGRCDMAIKLFKKIPKDIPMYYEQVYPEFKKCLQ